MIWKIIIKLIRCQKRNFMKAISTNDGIYIIYIHKFIPINEEIRQWKNALKKIKGV